MNYCISCLLYTSSENIMLRSGIYYNDAFFNVNNYIKLWKHNYLNCDAKIVTSESLSQHDFPFFIRPLRDDKSLDGQVVNTEYELLNIQSFFYNSGTYFCVSAIKNIHSCLLYTSGQFKEFIPMVISKCRGYCKQGGRIARPTRCQQYTGIYFWWYIIFFWAVFRICPHIIHMWTDSYCSNLFLGKID